MSDTDLIVPPAIDGGSLTSQQKLSKLLGGLTENLNASNFSGNRMELLRLTATAMAGDTRPGSELVGKRFTIKHWFVHPVDLTNPETGEVQTCPRTVLINDAGEAISFVSMGVLATLKVILDFMGHGDLGDGVTVEIQTRKTGGKRNILLLHPVVDD